MKATRYVWARGPRRVIVYAALAVAAMIVSSLPSCGFADGEADITVINATTGTIVTLQVKRNTVSNWGIDELRGIDLQPSQDFVIRDVEESEWYDIRATDSEGFIYAVERIRVSFDDESVTLTDGDLDGGTGELTLVNDTGVAWTNVYVKSFQDSGWGNPVLNMSLPAGASVSVPREIWDRYSVRAEAPDKRVFEVEGHRMNAKSKTEKLASDMLVSEAAIRLINGIDYGNGGDNSIMAVFIRTAGTTDWGPDRLSDSISNTLSRDYEVQPGTYDLKVVDVSGKTYQRMAIGAEAGWPAEVTVTINDAVQTP